ncbi:MAG: LLM class flavin-dependent oxidoreductase [Anaerolineales bacterium]|nr:LLM class flavin-dependent oxidoreductase [Anaerolineales bacterium]
MKYGLAFPYSSARAVAQWAKQAEEAGWDGIFLGDAIWCEDPLICLAAAAVFTRRLRLGTMIVPAPLRRPWKLASESVALDHLSDGRLILGLGTGATWMGWQGFPDEVTAPKIRAEMLDETIDILTLLYRSRPFDYDGKHYHLRLSQVDEQYYPPKPVQQPRIPLWVVGHWPRQASMQRVLKADGVFVEKMNQEGQASPVTPADIRALKIFVNENRQSTTPFDIVATGSTVGLSVEQKQEQLQAWEQAGATWWIEGLWEASPEQVSQVINQGLTCNLQ